MTDAGLDDNFRLANAFTDGFVRQYHTSVDEQFILNGDVETEDTVVFHTHLKAHSITDATTEREREILPIVRSCIANRWYNSQPRSDFWSANPQVPCSSSDRHRPE